MFSLTSESVSRETISRKMQEDLYDWLVELREQFGITQEDLADALNVSSRTVINWEGGHTRPKLTVSQMQALCRLFDLKIEELPEDFPQSRTPPPKKNVS